MGEMREIGSVLWKMARTIGIRECHRGSLCAKRRSPDQRQGMVCTVTETLTKVGKHMFLLVLFLPLPSSSFTFPAPSPFLSPSKSCGPSSLPALHTAALPFTGGWGGAHGWSPQPIAHPLVTNSNHWTALLL